MTSIFIAITWNEKTTSGWRRPLRAGMHQAGFTLAADPTTVGDSKTLQTKPSPSVFQFDHSIYLPSKFDPSQEHNGLQDNLSQCRMTLTKKMNMLAKAFPHNIPQHAAVNWAVTLVADTHPPHLFSNRHQARANQLAFPEYIFFVPTSLPPLFSVFWQYLKESFHLWAKLNESFEPKNHFFIQSGTW